MPKPSSNQSPELTTQTSTKVRADEWHLCVVSVLNHKSSYHGRYGPPYHVQEG